MQVRPTVLKVHALLFVSTNLQFHCSLEPDSVDQVLLSKYGIIRSGDHQAHEVSGIDQSNYVCFAPLSLSYSKMVHKKFTGQEELTSGEWTTW